MLSIVLPSLLTSYCLIPDSSVWAGVSSLGLHPADQGSVEQLRLQLLADGDRARSLQEECSGLHVPVWGGRGESGEDPPRPGINIGFNWVLTYGTNEMYVLYILFMSMLFHQLQTPLPYIWKYINPSLWIDWDFMCRDFVALSLSCFTGRVYKEWSG